ncbi:MAG: hypothetical protein WBA93_27570 [Microcoleaceae cyanobacterium]
MGLARTFALLTYRQRFSIFLSSQNNPTAIAHFSVHFSVQLPIQIVNFSYNSPAQLSKTINLK